MGAQDKLVKHLEAQGATVKKTKKGIMIYGPPPTRGTHTIHNTPSDHRALANDMAALRRIGLTHPLDKKPLTVVVGDGYPSYILNPVTNRVMMQAREELFKRGWPLEATTNMLSGRMASPTAEKAMYRLGYRHHPEGKKKGQSRIWVADEEIARLHEEIKANPLPDPEPDVEVRLREDAFDHGTPPKVGVAPREPEFHCDICGSDTHDGIGHPYVDDHQGEHVDFIDERDSWVVDPEELFGVHVMRIMKEKLDVLTAVGMDYEIRVWRKK